MGTCVGGMLKGNTMREGDVAGHGRVGVGRGGRR